VEELAYLCSVDGRSCYDEEDFVERDEDCDLVLGGVVQEEVEALTLYPKCRTRELVANGGDGISRERCVLNRDECLPDIEDFIPMQTVDYEPPTEEQEKYISISPPCTCQLVATGLCFLTTINPPTSDSTFCAVGPWDCPLDYSYINALTLNTLNKDPNQSAPRQCTLCRSEDINTVEIRHEHLVRAGGCYTNPTTLGFGDGSESIASTEDEAFQRCVLEAEDCGEGEIHILGLNLLLLLQLWMMEW